jgi:hypothetical protein
LTDVRHRLLRHSRSRKDLIDESRSEPHDGITIVLLSNQANSGARSFLGLALVQIMLGQS